MDHTSGFVLEHVRRASAERRCDNFGAKYFYPKRKAPNPLCPISFTDASTPDGYCSALDTATTSVISHYSASQKLVKAHGDGNRKRWHE